VLRRAPASTLAVLATALVASVAGCDTGDGKEMRVPTSEQRANLPTTTTTTSTVPGVPSDVAGAVPGASTGVPTTGAATPAPFGLALPWANGGSIDARFTCDGTDLSPLMTWTAPPAGTVELALLVRDDDADGYVHWAVSGILPTAGEKGEGATITGAFEGVNDAGTVGWSGPCPPVGDPHTYRFSLYALGQQAELPEGFTGAELAAVAEPAAIAVAELTGTYSRAG
jgi:Raf kinase inhibitor-like YbhB/YbcL family protein